MLGDLFLLWGCEIFFAILDFTWFKKALDVIWLKKK